MNLFDFSSADAVAETLRFDFATETLLPGETADRLTVRRDSRWLNVEVVALRRRFMFGFLINRAGLAHQ